MDLKKQLKNIANTTVGGKVQIHIDYVFRDSGVTIVSGWTIAPLQTRVDDLKIKSRNAKCSTLVISYDRPDVEANITEQNGRFAFGFAMIIADDVPLADLSVELGLCIVSLKEFTQELITNIQPILHNSGDKADEILDAVEEFGLTVKQSTDTKALDPDIAFVKDLVETLDPTNPNFVSECHDSVLPQLHERWEKRLQQKNNVEVVRLGDTPTSPAVSLIIPLYGRYDFIQHQISKFASDPYFSDVEVIYVVDDPKLAHEIKVTAKGVFNVFGLPFKLVLSSINLGFAGANNLGVEHASSNTLLLLNSDVLPASSGWLKKMLTEFEAQTSCGIMSAVLLYEDDTVQHLGMNMVRDPALPNLWMNYHPHKGIPISLVYKQGIESVQAVTGACMMLRKSLYADIKGFEPLYVLGDFEDSDLCLKVMDKGLSLLVNHDIRLYHLERLSQDLMSKDLWKQKLTYVNAAFQVKRWKTRLMELDD